jgi:hypothetical protein
MVNKLVFLLLLLLISPVTAGECHTIDNVGYCNISDNITSEIRMNQIDNLTFYLNETFYFDSIYKTNLTFLSDYNKTYPYNMNLKYGSISIWGKLLDFPVYHEYTQNGYLIIMVHYRGGK